MKLSVTDLNSFYGPAHILFDIALEVGEGEVVALLGRNGAGKSTTFRSIVGLVAQRVRAGSCSKARTYRLSRRMRSCVAGSVTCRRSGASSPI